MAKAQDYGLALGRRAVATGAITVQQYQATVRTMGSRCFEDAVIESGALDRASVDRLRLQIARGLAQKIDAFYALELMSRGLADAKTIEECRSAQKKVTSQGFDFDLLDFMGKRQAVDPQAAEEIRRHIREQFVFCPLCLEAVSSTQAKAGTSVICRCGKPFHAREAIHLAGPPADGTVTTTSQGPILGEYQLLHEIGRGGMGVVYDARQVTLKRRVALKVLKANVATDRSSFDRFHREAEALAKLDHPNIVKVYGSGQTGGNHYFAMEFVEGRTLDKLVTEARLDAKRTCGWVRDIARAVQAAHEAGIIHRDIKPGNIIVDPKNRPVLTDFGLVHVAEARNLTLSGEAVGTPQFMSPEQAKAEHDRIGPRTDVYGLGITLYTALRGRAPFPRKSLAETLHSVTKEVPAVPSESNKDVDRDLDAILMKAIQKDPDRRYPTAASFADDLDRWLQGRPTAVRPRRRGLGARPLLLGAAGAAAVGVVIAIVMAILAADRRGADEIAARDRAKQEEIRRKQDEATVALEKQRLADAEKRRLEDVERKRIEEDARKAAAADEERRRLAALEAQRRIEEEQKARERAQRLAEVVATFKSELRLKRGQADDVVREAGAQEARGDIDAALQTLDRAAEMYRALPAVLSSATPEAAEAMREDEEASRLGDVEGALAAVRRQRALFRSTEAWLHWLRKRDVEGALAIAAAAQKEDPDCAEPRIVRATILLRAGRLDDAETAFRAAAQGDARDRRPLVGRAEIALLRSKLPDAEALLAESEPLDGSMDDCHYVKGAILLARKKPEECLKLLEEILQGQQGSSDLRVLRGRAFLMLGRHKEAFDATRTIPRMAGLAAGSSASRTGRWSGRTSSIYEGCMVRARSALALGHKAEAREACEAALKVTPADSEAKKLLAQAK